MKKETKKLNSDDFVAVFVGVVFFCLFFIFFAFSSINNSPSTGELSDSIFSYGKGSNLEVFEDEVDDKGIPIVTEGFTSGNGYHPTPICRYGVYLTSRYLNNPNDEDLKKIKNVMNWIQENKVNKITYAVWYLNEDLESFNLKAPWTSAMTNSFCAGALLGGYTILGDRSLERDAKKAIEYLFVPVEQGGGMYTFENGDIWFEEAPSVENPSHILNGCIFAIDMLDMFRAYYETPKYEEHYEKIVSSVKNRVGEYDVGYGSIYDLWSRNNKLGMSYHRIHYVQLYYLYLSTGDEYFRDLSLKWYELQRQSEYEIIEASSTVENPLHCAEMLNDETYWYRYWQASLPSEVIVDFERSETIKAINFFGLSGSSPFKNADIYYYEEDKYVLIEPKEYKVQYEGLSISGDNRTNIYTLMFNSELRVNRLKFIFNTVDDREYVYLREVGFWKDLEADYDVEMNKFSSFKDIVEERK